MATIEAKLAQQLAYLDQEAMFGIFVDLRKVYDAMDQDQCLECRLMESGPRSAG